MKKKLIIIVSLLAAIVGVYFYFEYRSPPGLIAKGDSTETLAWISLATAIIGMITAVVTLLQQIITLKGNRRE